MRVEIEGGKYTYQFHPDGRSEVLRYGEPWRDVVGDKFIYCMASEIEQLRQRVAELEKERDEARRVTFDPAVLEEMNKLTAERDKAAQYWQIAEGRCDALVKQRDELVAAATKAAEEIRKCDYTPARSTLLVAIASIKEKS